MRRLDFQQRVSRIVPHGLGLSVDLYTPDLGDLMQALEAAGVSPAYLEVFKASDGGLQQLRQQWPSLPLVYHAEGLWVTQPDLTEMHAFEPELAATASQLDLLGASWLTHECASKQMAGYAFGTYLPPLCSMLSAEVTARNIRLVQRRLDALTSARACRPLFLVETPPLTYFGFGDLDLAEFFTAITDRAACGVVLDIGHLWTIYRYTGAWQRGLITEFLHTFLDRFPLERVVQIHVAGLGPHEKVSESVRFQSHTILEPVEPLPSPAEPPLWIDRHDHPIPAVLFEMLEQVLQHPRLMNLRGVALEVDNKPIDCIVEEFERFSNRFLPTIRDRTHRAGGTAGIPTNLRGRSVPVETEGGKREISEQYRRYARAVSGLSDETPGPAWSEAGLQLYRQSYLPHEISTWGDDLLEMFPLTCRRLKRAGVSLDGFVAFWFREPRHCGDRYDFFLLKVERFVGYVTEILPEAVPTVRGEAASLREAYAIACR